MSPLETRTDSPEETPEVRKLYVSTGEESSGSGPDSTQGLRPRHRRERNPEKPPRNWHGDWPFLRPPERVPEVSVLKKFPDIPLSTREEARGSRSHPEELRFRLVGREEGSFRCLFGERILGVPVPSQEEVLSTGKTRTNSPVETPEVRKLYVSTGEEFSGSGPDSTQGLRPRHRRERNPERPPRNSHGDWPFLRPPERVPEVPVTRTNSPVETPEVRKLYVSTGEEFSGSGPDSTQGLRPRHRRERNPERPPRNSHGDWPFLRPPERVPEVPVPRIDSHHVCTWESPVGKPRGKASWERLEGNPRGKGTDLMIDTMASVTLLLQLGRKAHVHASSREED
ncbi:hypothetical protein MJG53_000156 [Ovis ammon polii x Ovis aries]|nr:hypothetical protein MJG53_000156 [Ovis ammon polii x Ovis aries]